MTIYDENTTLKQKRTAMANDIKKTLIKAEKNNQSIVIRGNGGIGKSTTTIKRLHKMGRKVLLCLQSNANVKEKADEYNKLKINSFGDTSLKFNLANHHEYPTHMKMKKPQHVWDHGRVGDESEAIREVKKEYPHLSDEEALQVVEECKSNLPDWDTYDVIVCTQARYQNLKLKHGQYHNDSILPSDVVVIIDDPFADSVKNYYYINPLNTKNKIPNVNGKPIEVIESQYFNNVKFFVKPDSIRLDYKSQNTMIWLTTESVVTDLLVSDISPIVLDYTEGKNPDGGEVEIISSKMTRQKVHAIIPVLVHQIGKVQKKRDKNKPVFCGNGLGWEFNNHTIKGSNEFMDKSMIFKISQPPMAEFITVAEQLGNSDLEEIKSRIMLDNFDQCAFRNRGFRYASSKSVRVKNSECILIVDPQYSNYIHQNTEHNTTLTDIDKNPVSRAYPESRDTLTLLVWHLCHWKDYVMNDIKGVDSRGKSKHRIKNDLYTVLIQTNIYHLGNVVELLDGQITELLEDRDRKASAYSVHEPYVEYLQELLFWLKRQPTDIRKDRKEIFKSLKEAA